MISLVLREFHQSLGGRFDQVNGMEVVRDYGEPLIEHAALHATAGVLDLSLRSRVGLTGADRQRFLNGQVTNNVKDLKPGQGCYAALVSAKGKLQSDLNIYCLPNELLLDFESGFGVAVAQRFEKFIIADDVQIVDAAPHYGLLSVQGPQAGAVVSRLQWGIEAPAKPLSFVSITDSTLGEIYVTNHARTGTGGFDLFVPNAALGAVADKLFAAAKFVDGRACGWQALEWARIEAGIPRFGVDMDESNLAPEAGIESRAISYSKGCYIGQEVIARIRTYGQVAKSLCGLRLAENLKALPRTGDKLYRGDKEIGYVTSAMVSPTLKSNIALSYVRREASAPGTELTLKMAEGAGSAVIVELPFVPTRNPKP